MEIQNDEGGSTSPKAMAKKLAEGANIRRQSRIAFANAPGGRVPPFTR